MDQLLNLALVPSIETPPESKQLVQKVNSSIRRCLSRRENTIRTLKMVADEMDDVHKRDRIGSSIGYGIGIAGSTATIVGGALTYTGVGAGIGVPLCMWGGFGAGLAGSGVKFGFSTWKEKKEENIFTKLIIAFEKDQEAFVLLHEDLERLMNSRYSKHKFSLFGLGLPIAQKAAAKAAVKQAQEIASKVAGSFTMFIGFVTTFFKIHGLAKKLAEESLGQEIRKLAEKLERSGNNTHNRIMKQFLQRFDIVYSENIHSNLISCNSFDENKT